MIKEDKYDKYLFPGAVGRISYGLKNEFELDMVNEPSVFQLSKVRLYTKLHNYTTLFKRSGLLALTLPHSVQIQQAAT